MTATLIKNGRIVTAVDDYGADILVNTGRVHTIGRDLSVGPDVEVHDAAGLLVLPGGVDVHTHLDWEFGTSRTVDTHVKRLRRKLGDAATLIRSVRGVGYGFDAHDSGGTN